MTRVVGLLVFFLAALAAALPALAQSGDGVQLRLTNRMNEKVDYYLIPQGGKPTFAGSVEAGAVVDVEARPGQGYVFAVNRVPFQRYTTRSEVFQGLTLAPQGQQKPPVVANSRQKPASGGKIVEAAPADSGGSGPGVSEDGLIWMFSQFQNDRGVDTSVLYFSVPETDNVQFSAACSAQDATPRVILSADVSRLKNGAAASVRFLASGFDATLKGKVRLSESGEGQDGIDMAIAADDPLWQAFGMRNAMNYSVQGQAPLRLPLAGVQEPLGNFLRDCAQFASGGGGGGGVVSDATQLFSGGGGPADTSGAAADSCAALDGVVSKNGGKTVAVEFVNRTDEYRVLLWIDFDGTPVEYTQLEAGQSFQVETSSTHPWMVTDGPGNCIEKFMPKPGQSQILISRKSPGFGDE